MLETTVVVIGGGATGMGTLRDLCMRGIPAILVEQGGLAHGTSSRFHGLLHSGGRYAVTDNASARECIEENRILRRIGRFCVEGSEGLFALTPADDPAWVEPWVAACARAGIDAQELEVGEALRLEPRLSPEIRRVFRVPDAGIDGFRLVVHNAMSARRYGGRVLTYHELTAIHQNGGRISGVTVLDKRSGQSVAIACQALVNAAGSWAGRVAELAGLRVPIAPDRGTLIVFNHRFASRVLNRLHRGADGDIFVPHGSITMLGTTSSPATGPSDTRATSAEVLRLLDLGEALFPELRQYRILRAFAGTRPLMAADGATGRQASRSFQVRDHGADGLLGMFSIFGGKLTTYRLMAEKVCDRVAAYLELQAVCRTAEEALVPEPARGDLERAARYFPVQGLQLMVGRLGDELPAVIDRAAARARHALPGRNAGAGNPLLCECEMVTLAEIECVGCDAATHSLTDIRLRTRLGMGTCQGTFCSVRSIGALVDQDVPLDLSPVDNVRSFLQERWRGLRPALWGTQARELELGRAVYGCVLNLDGVAHAKGN